MGNLISNIRQKRRAKRAKARSDAIDRLLEEESKRFKKECKVLFLGSGDSGLSTIVKQMKITYQGGYSHKELTGYRSIIYKNVLDSAHNLCRAIKNYGFESQMPENRQYVDDILNFGINPKLTYALTDGITEKIQAIWRDPITSKLMDHYSNEFYLMDSASYLFNEVNRIGAPGYVPTDMDVLNTSLKSTGINETAVQLGSLRLRMFEIGGQQSERKKWIHCFECVTCIVFCTALSEYDQVLLEERSQNRMHESLILFECIINSRWFLRTSIILLMTKLDEFKAKLRMVPLSRYFPEYTGGDDINKAAKYILWKFMQANRARLSVYPHLTSTNDTASLRLVFSAVKETLLQNALKDSGVL